MLEAQEYEMLSNGSGIKPTKLVKASLVGVRYKQKIKWLKEYSFSMNAWYDKITFV